MKLYKDADGVEFEVYGLTATYLGADELALLGSSAELALVMGADDQVGGDPLEFLVALESGNLAYL